MISTFTGRRDLLIDGARPRLPAPVVVAEKRLADAAEFGTHAEVSAARRKLLSKVDAAIRETDDDLGRISGTPTVQDRNTRAFLSRRKEALERMREKYSAP